jgi:ABC-type branched-subunit amino acid transport system permease subunit
MSTVNGLPAHILLNHFVVVLGPLTAILAILCALWPAARRRLIWLVLLVSVATLVLTPLTTNSGVWLRDKLGPSPAIKATIIVLTAVHIRQTRGHTVKLSLHAVVGLLVIAAAVATLVQSYRVGESGARAAWGTVASAQTFRPNCSATARRSSERFAVCGSSPAT